VLDDQARLQRLTALIETSPDSVAVVGPDGRLELLNRAGRRLVGLSEEQDVTSTALVDLLTPAGAAAVAHLDVADGGPWTGESELRGPDGTGVPVVVTSFVLPDPETGQPLGRAWIQSDLREARVASAKVATAQQALQSGLERQRALLVHMSDLLVVVDARGALTYASPSASRLLGYAERRPLGESVLDLVHPDDRALARRALEQCLQRPGPGEPVRVRLLTGSGASIPFEALPSNLLHEPSVGGVVIAARDITERERHEQSLQAQTRVLELIASGASVEDVLLALATWVEQALDGIRCSVLLLQDGRARGTLRDAASPSMPAEYRAAVDGLSVGAAFSPCAVAVTRHAPVLVRDLLAEEQWAPMHPLAQLAGVRSCWSYPVTSPATGARLGTFALYGDRPGLPDEQTSALMARASHLVGITVDRHQLVARLDHQARHDALTGLPNRRELLDSLTEALERCAADQAPCPVVVFLDLDRLKVINDSLGHEIGDELLVDLGQRLRASVSPMDLVARFGGDEFVVLSSQPDVDVDALVANILKVVSEPVVLEGRVLTPAASAGVVVAASQQTATEVLRDADIAMYRAKHRGGAGWALFGEEMRQRAFDRLDLEAQIRHGMANEQFRVFYQPIVDLQDADRVSGFEALVRWEHPERGLLEPGHFLELAVETGLVVPLGEWVLRTAAATVQGWVEGLPTEGLTLSVNLAVQQLSAPGLVGLVQVSKDAIAPWTLGLEFTESALMDDTAAVARAVAELAATGAELSIDDFGTGFSSLSYLTRLPVQRLKIDMSFVADLEHKPEARTVAATIIGLAEKLSLTVVAEGVETPEQRARLLDLGCRYAQGYLFSRPVPEAEALAMLQRGLPGLGG
jgi:diguanylate cyclase (GGDEF)-like protein/PAS domain S-box-containing protein